MAADLSAPAGEITLLPRSWRLTSSGVKPTACSRTGSSPDANLALDASDALDPRHPADPLQRT